MYRSSTSVTGQSSFEVLVLVLISQGLTTTYALQSEAGLSLGATVPALKRLSGAKLVTKKIEGRRHEFSLTRAGGAALREWCPPSGRIATDCDDLLRTAFLTALLRRNLTAAAEILRQAARARSRAAEGRADELRANTVNLGKLDASAYLWMRTVSEQHRLAAESKAMDLIAAEFSPAKKETGKRVRRRR